MKKKKAIKTLTIDRSRWLTGSYRGLDDKGSVLENPDGERCCLGFLAAACGIPKEFRIGALYPGDMPRSLRLRMPDRFVRPDRHANGIASERAIKANDDHDITVEEREERVRAAFELGGISVRFVGEYPTF